MNYYQSRHPQNNRHKVFVSYHHAKDQYYKDRFETLFAKIYDTMESKSVEEGDIDPNLNEDGDEQTALDSVYSLFATTRDILTEYGREAPEFSKLAVLILNQKIRPFTAKWHVPSIEGAFEDPEKCKEFRQDLEERRVILCGYMAALAALAGVEDITDISEE